MLTMTRLTKLMRYDSETGIFIRLVSTSNIVRVGDRADSHVGNGYRRVWIDGRRYFAHRLAWFYVHGEWPKDEIDHINGNPSDNRIGNLREASRSQNLMNTRLRSDNMVGLKGVTEFGCRWRATIKDAGKQRHLGLFDTPEAAHDAYRCAAEKIFGEYARP